MIRKILAPIDGSEHTARVLEAACDLASKYGAPVYLIYVFSVIHLTALSSRSHSDAALEDLEDQEREAAVEIIREAERYMAKNSIEVAQTYLTEGDPADEILKFAKRKRIDTIVIGSHGATGVLAAPLGSVCQKVCHLAEQTCVIVK
jgi:nucleotide-binding universal stress UspA family protein